MNHVVTKPMTPLRTSSGRLEVHQVPAWQDNLIWLLVAKETGEAAIIDGPEAGPVIAACAAHGFEVTTIFNTHTHGDHIGVNRDLAGRGMLDRLEVVGPAGAQADVPGITRPVGEGDTVHFAGAEGRVMLTEGHIDGHVSYLFDDVLFCGDTLFGAGCGYLFDGPPEKMYRSLSRLRELPPETHVCCAHEYTQDNLRFAWTVEPENAALAGRIQHTWPIRATGASVVPSTIGLERDTNPFMRFDAPALRRHVAGDDADALSDAAIFARTRALKDTKRYRELGDTHLPL